MPTDMEAEFPAGGAIVFGGSGAIGAAVAALLADRGCGVALTYHSTPAKAEQTVAEITAKGGDAFSAQCDILDKQSVQAVVDAAVERFGSIHTVMLATGRIFSNYPMADMNVEDFEQQMRTDTSGFFHVIKSSVPRLRERGGGTITVIMAVTLERIFPNNGMAAVPKLAQAGMIKFLAREEAANGIRVNGVAPGVVDDGMSRKMLARSPEVTSSAADWTPMGREGTVAEIAETGVFLASRKAGFTTGQIMVIDGGLTL